MPAPSPKMRSPPSYKGGDLDQIRSETQLLEPPLNRARWFAGLVPTWGFSPSAGGKRMMSRVLLRGDLGGSWLTLHGASDGFLGGAIVEVLDLLVVLGFPVNEHADGDVEIVRLVGGNPPFCHGVGDGLGHGVLRRTEHLHRLARVLDRHLVVEDRWGLREKVGRDHRKKRGEAVLVVGQSIAERGLHSAAAGTDQQIDVSNFIAVTDERFTYTDTTNLGHKPS